MVHQQIIRISLYYEVQGTGEPLILISGCEGDQTFWTSSISILASYFQIIVFDTRGIGQTDAPEGEYTRSLFAEDIVDVLRLNKTYRMLLETLVRIQYEYLS